VILAILDIKADAVDLAKFKSQMPKDAAKLVDSLLKNASIAVTAAGRGDIADLVCEDEISSVAPLDNTENPPL
jgi:hypothetical protein